MSLSSCRLVVSSESHLLVSVCRVLSHFSGTKIEVQILPSQVVPRLIVDNSEFSYFGPIARLVAGSFFPETLKHRAEHDTWATWAETEVLTPLALPGNSPFPVIKALDSLIGARAFICGAKPSLADVVAFVAVACNPASKPSMARTTSSSTEIFVTLPAAFSDFPNASRWAKSCLQEFPAFREVVTVAAETDADAEGGESKAAEKKRLKEEAKAKAKAKAAKAAEVAAASGQAGTFEYPVLTLKTMDSCAFGRILVQSELGAGSTGRVWTAVTTLTPAMKGENVWIRGRAQFVRKQSSKLAFITVRDGLGTVQAVALGDLAKFAGVALTKESVVDIFGEISTPDVPVHSCSQSLVEVQVARIYLLGTKSEALPLQLDDLNRGEHVLAAGASTGGEAPATVALDARLSHRIIDLRTRANQAIFRMQSMVCTLFREYLLERSFVEIHTPKLIATASEGGADVFRLNYFGGFGYLAQSPQLYKQMALMGDLSPGVFEIAPVFRAENSLTHRHMTEFIGLDMEMTIKESFTEVMDTMDGIFNHIFRGLNERCKAEIEAVRAQYPFEDLKWEFPCRRFRFDEAWGILKAEGVKELQREIAELQQQLAGTEGQIVQFRLEKLREHMESIERRGETDDIGTSDEKLLGRIVREKFNTDFYIIEKFPKTVRPFYTMPCPEVPEKWTNSYDVFLRGEEIVSGAQRIHDSELLLKVAQEKGVDLSPIQDYVDSFKFGAFPHGGGGVGLERVVMLFLGISNIRYCSMFPRDPKRITP